MLSGGISTWEGLRDKPSSYRVAATALFIITTRKLLMKQFYSLFFLHVALILALQPISASSQPAGYKDRLARVRDLVNSDELIMIWGQGPSQNDQSIYQRIYDLNLTHPGGVDSTLVSKPVQIDSSITGNKRLAVATGNFLGDKLKHVVAAWAGPGNSVSISVPHIQAGTLSWQNASRLSMPGLAPFGANKKIHVAAGDFFGNRQDEFVLAYHGADTTIHLQVFSFNPGDLAPQPRGSLNDERMMPPGSNLDNLEIVTGDFDSDGYDDIALLFVKPTLGGSNWSLYAKIYTVDDQGNLVPKASLEVFQRPAYSVTNVNLAGASGALDRDSALEIAFGFCFAQEESGPDTYLYLLDVKDNLNTIIASETRRIARDELNESEIEPLDVAAGDLNKNNRDEIVLMVGETFYIYSSDDQLVPQFRAQRSVSTTGDNSHSDAFLAVGDMDLDRSSEIIVAKSQPGDGDPGAMQHFEIQVFAMDTLLTNFTLKARRMNEMPILADNGFRHYAIALGDFDGDRIRLGAPVHYRRTGVMQPTVILYTPPIHYDIFGTTIVDLSGCYPAQSCGFSSTYIQSTTIDTTVVVEIHEDWGGDVTITTSAAFVKAKVKETYGDKFSLKEKSSKSLVVTTGRIAAGDDWIYANVYDIDFYEYPVYDSLETILGYFLVSIPGTPRPLWIESKDDHALGNQFRADHEVGNVLSYSPQSTFDTSRVIVDFPEQTIGSTGNSFASLQISSFRENSVESSWDAGFEIGGSIDLAGELFGFDVGLEVEVNGHYNYGEIYTQTVKVGNSLEVRGDLGHLQPQFGTSGTYHVKPYAYWTSYGALVLDYKVSSLPTGANSFWQARYGGKVDLALSLPWRYDAEKGFPLPGNDPSYRYRSRDVALSKAEPLAGDTVMIGVRVRNLGLQAITTPVVVRFYDGEPSSGGSQIAEATIDTVIAPRGSRNVFVPWAIPDAQQLSTTRIYVVIDPDNLITNEVHENNNMGWAPAVARTLTSVETTAEVPNQFVLYQSYPNPFNPTTTIRFDLRSAGHVSLKVFNVLGQEVVTLLNEVRPAGSHRIHFNASVLASGVYFYRIHSGSFFETKKMIFLR